MSTLQPISAYPFYMLLEGNMSDVSIATPDRSYFFIWFLLRDVCHAVFSHKANFTPIFSLNMPIPAIYGFIMLLDKYFRLPFVVNSARPSFLSSWSLMWCRYVSFRGVGEAGRTAIARWVMRSSCHVMFVGLVFCVRLSPSGEVDQNMH
jgi:hypothetical protein